ncbi:MAG: zinc-ribbon domain-containing protein [Candidatus Hermodarchaeota archaeon]
MEEKPISRREYYKFCPFCGSKIKNTYLYCIECGSSLNDI